VLALDEVLALENPASYKIYVNELRKLHIGQSHDLHWSQNNYVPTIPEYLEMIADSTKKILEVHELRANTIPETGGLFCMLGGLMGCESKAP